MRNKLSFAVIFLIITASLLNACQVMTGHPQAANTVLPVVTQEPGVIAQGKLTPQNYVNLSFNTGGKVEELPVAEGDTLDQGQVIARLDQREQLSAAVDNAQFELVNAQQALKDLKDNASVNTALAQQKVAAQRDVLRDAERYVNNLKAGSKGVDIDTAQANAVILKDRLDAAWKDYAPYENKDPDSVKRAELLSKYADAQRKYDNAIRLLNNLQGTASEIDMAIAEANLSLAQASLALAEQEYDKVKEGPDPDQLASAQARVKAAETGLKAAQEALANRELVAPFTGKVAKLNLKLGEQVIPGEIAVVLADFSSWVIETDDLTENEVPSIYPEQEVLISFDALPDLELKGKVLSISDINTDKNGDVTYTTKVVLTENNPRLRWGMSAVLNFSEK